MPRNREGELLGERYRVVDADGEGWSATDLTSGKRVHVAFVPRAAREGAKHAKALTGAHIVKVVDFGETAEGATWIAREYVSCDSLTKHLARRGPMSLHDAIECALGVCDAIAEAHGHGLTHGALDASNVYLAFSASGLVDVQVAGIATSCPPQQRDDVRSIVKLIESMLGGRMPADLTKATSNALRVLDLADALVPFAQDIDFAGDRVEARRTRSSTSASVFAEGAYPQTLPGLAPALRAVPPKPAKRPENDVAKVEIAPDSKPAPKPDAKAASKSELKSTLSPQEIAARESPTIVATRVSVLGARRRFIPMFGVFAAAASVALLVIVGTEGARLARSAKPNVAQAMEIPPPVATTPLVVPSATETVPVVRADDLPAAPVRPHRRATRR